MFFIVLSKPMNRLLFRSEPPCPPKICNLCLLHQSFQFGSLSMAGTTHLVGKQKYNLNVLRYANLTWGLRTCDVFVKWTPEGSVMRNFHGGSDQRNICPCGHCNTYVNHGDRLGLWNVPANQKFKFEIKISIYLSTPEFAPAVHTTRSHVIK